MSMSTGAYGRAASSRRKSSRKIIPQHFLGSVAVAGLVLGCAWTVYSNVLSAGIYPSMNTAVVDAHVVKRSVAAAARPAVPAANSAMAALSDPAAQSSRAETLSPQIMFNERFAASAPQGVDPQPVEATRLAEISPPSADQIAKPVDAPKLAEAPKKIETPKLAEAPKSKEAATPPAQVALNVPAPAPKQAEAKPAAKTPGATVRDMAQRAKAAVMSIASNDKPTIVEKLWGKQASRGSLLSYASADASVTGSLPDTRAQNPMLGGSPPYDKQTAVYDISARMVYLPDGTKLEAHSGLGSKLDDVRYSHVRMQGVTPPHIYELTPREALFHGVPALRLNPIGGEDKIFGRSGLLAHTYMLGPNGDSNGCVSFKDYYAFLRAYREQGIKRLAVLAKVE
ncbi:tlde1 domain-containing protein [Bradyrhizobium sp. KBS0727]|uniref:tlde1 domain-containing protein n=1 Tax=unclassified Bradyrhizobium TaxID=2631580 RepID=UPI00352D016A